MEKAGGTPALLGKEKEEEPSTGSRARSGVSHLLHTRPPEGPSEVIAGGGVASARAMSWVV